MKQLKRVFLVGPMGAGKTTIGKHLSSELSLPFFDSDREIERRCGTDISWIFDVEGEAGFREREHQMLIELCKEEGVIATGGGMVLRKDNRELLAQSGVVVYLNTSVQQQVARTQKDKKRPLLQTDSPEAVLAELMEQRGGFYQEVADVVVDTNSRNPKVVAKEIADKVYALSGAMS